MIRRQPGLLVCALLLTTAAGCLSHSNHATTSPAVKGDAIRAVFVAPPTPGILVDVPMALRLADRTNKPIRGAKVQLVLTMPSMPMPPNIVILHETDPGHYQGSGIFTMAGRWEVLARATTAHNGSLLRQYRVDVR